MKIFQTMFNFIDPIAFTEPGMAYSLACIWLFGYMVLSSIEFGAAFFMLLPEQVLERKAVRTYVNPIWETTNIFLVFFVMTIFICFPNAELLLSPVLYPIISIAILFFAARVVGILGLFYGDSGALAWRLSFFIGSWGAALTLADALYVFLIGHGMNWPLDTLSISLLLLVITTILLISTTFFLRFTRKKAVHPQLERLSYVSLLVWYAAAALYLIGPFHQFPHMVADTTSIGYGFIGVTVLALAIPVLVHFKAYTRAFVASMLALGMLFAGSAYFHLPYLIYPDMTIFDAFTSPAVFHATEIAGAIGFIFLVPALVLLYWLFA